MSGRLCRPTISYNLNSHGLSIRFDYGFRPQEAWGALTVATLESFGKLPLPWSGCYPAGASRAGTCSGWASPQEIRPPGTALPTQETGSLRNIAVTAVTVRARGFVHAASRTRWSAATPPALVIGAVALVVAGLLVGLPAKPVAGQPLPTFAPLAPQADGHRTASNLPLDAPFLVQFTKPMNPGTVETALQVTPPVPVKFLWDATGQQLSLAPDPHWQPYTSYTVDISTDATDQEGLNLAKPVHTTFESGSPTAGTVSATRMVDDRAAPGTAFQISFTRPVKLSTVLLRVGISPKVDFAVSGDDPTDAASQVFTITPKAALHTDTMYMVSMADGGTDSSGAALRPVDPLTVTTLKVPTAKFTPQAGAVANDTNQPISVSFSVTMDEKSTAAATKVEVNGRAVSGTIGWTDNDQTMTWSPKSSYPVGARISIRVAATARSEGGLTLAATTGVDFSIAAPRVRSYGTTIRTTSIPWTGGVASSSAPYHSAELYYLSLMNCTRTGGWVTSSGECSTATHHTMPARAALAFSDPIANQVARPYAKALADRGLLTHNLDGTSTHSRLCTGGFCGGSWGENIASPSNAGSGGMISIEVFFQNESPCRCAHYYNIMNPYFHRAGVGIWVSSGTRVVIDFYG